MSVFIGSNAGETITPELVSPSVTVHGTPKQPSAAVDLIFAGGGDDTVAGGGGNDRAFLGAGNDTFIWRPGDGSDFVDGGSGADRLVFDGSAAAENITVSAGHQGLAQVTRDVGQVTMNLHSVERIEIAALDGQDRITVNDLSRTDVKEVAINFAGAVNPNAGDGQADSIAVDGTRAGDQIAVASSGGSVAVSGLAATTTIDHIDGGVDQLLISAGGGDDRIDASGVAADSIRLTLDGGSGNDTLIGGGGADTLLGGDGNDLVLGGRGNDVAFLGAGDDTFVWNPGDGSDTVEGGAGTDTMLFNGANIAENVDISANGERALFHRDVANITMDLNDVEHIQFNALGGADNITVNDLSGTDVKQVAIDLAGVVGSNVGDGQQDQVNVLGTAGNDKIAVVQNGDSVIVQGLAAQVTIEHAEAQNDLLVINGGAGDDTIDASGLDAGHIGVQLLGGDGADKLVGSAGNDLVLGGRGNDVAFLGAGDDTFVWNPGDGSDVVEGGTGTDTMLFNGANIAENIDISANGARALFHRDVANINMDLNDVEHIDFTALGGADNITVNDLSGTDVNQVNIDLAATLGGTAGDNQTDTVEIKGTDGNDVIKLSLRDGALVVGGLAEEVVIKNFDLTDAIHIAGLGGDDVIDASALGVGAPQITLDGGAGDDVLIGGAGNDTLLGGAGDDILQGGPGLDVLDGGPGNNVLIQSLVMAGSNAYVSPSGEGSDILMHGQVMIEDFQASPGGATVAGANAQDAGSNFFPGFGAGEQMPLAHVDVASLHADNLLL